MLSRSLMACSVLVCAAGTGAGAATIPADLIVAGEYLFDDTGGSFVAGNASQSGTLFARVGGGDDTTTYSDETVVSGNNPVTATFTEHGGGAVGGGDGFGGTGSGGAEFSFPFFLDDEFRADTDQTTSDGVTPLTFTNTSGVLSYRVVMSLTYDHTVESDGFDAFAESDLELDLDGVSVRDAKIVSDTFLGNEIDDVSTGDAGGVVMDSGVFTFDFLVVPGGSSTLEIDYTLEGGAFFPGSSASGSSSYFLSIDDVVAIPEPAVLLLTGLGVCVLYGRSGSRV